MRAASFYLLRVLPPRVADQRTVMGVARKPDHAAFAGAQLSVQRARRYNMFMVLVL